MSHLFNKKAFATLFFTIALLLNPLSLLFAGGETEQSPLQSKQQTEQQVNDTSAPQQAVSPAWDFQIHDFLEGEPLVTGQILDAETGSPVAGAVITLADHPGLAWSDHDGNFVLKDIQGNSEYDQVFFNPEQAVLRVTHNEYEAETEEIVIGSVGAVTVSMKPDPAAFIFDPDEMKSYYLTITPENMTYMDEHILEEQYVPANLTFNGQDWGQIGIRYKGSEYSLGLAVDDQGHRNIDKVSLKLKFDKYQKELDFFGLERLNLQAMNGDPSMMVERMGYDVFQKMGIPAPRVTFCKVYINGEFAGVYDALEQIDKSFVKHQYKKGGVLYKEIWPNAAFIEDIPRQIRYAPGKDSEADTSAMTGWINDLDSMDSADFLTSIGRYTDLYELTRYIAVDRAINNSDGIMAWYGNSEAGKNHNYYIYHHPDGRFYLIPWDMTEAFIRQGYIQENGVALWDDLSTVGKTYPRDSEEFYCHAPASDPLLRMTAENAHGMYEYYGRLIAETLITPEYWNPVLDRWEAQLPEAMSERRLGHSRSEWERGMDALRFFQPRFSRRFTALLDRDRTGEREQRFIQEEQNQTTFITSDWPGLSLDKMNTFEWEAHDQEQRVPRRISVWSPFDEILRVNTDQPIAGTSDLLVESSFTGTSWERYVAVTMPFEGGPQDLSKIKAIALSIRTENPMTLSVTLESGEYQRSYPLYSVDHVINGGDKQILFFELGTFSQPTWDWQKTAWEDVIKNVDGISISIAPNDYSGKPITCRLQVEGISFIE